jgi:hypothetical protein
MPMWARFSDDARRAIFYAQEEAARLGESFVSTEHLLLALTRDSESAAARVLQQLGVIPQQLRFEVERRVSQGPSKVWQETQLTPRAKRVIDLAYEEARHFNDDYVGTEHLLLGLIREAEGLAGSDTESKGNRPRAHANRRPGTATGRGFTLFAGDRVADGRAARLAGTRLAGHQRPHLRRVHRPAAAGGGDEADHSRRWRSGSLEASASAGDDFRKAFPAHAVHLRGGDGTAWRARHLSLAQ